MNASLLLLALAGAGQAPVYVPPAGSMVCRTYLDASDDLSGSMSLWVDARNRRLRSEFLLSADYAALWSPGRVLAGHRAMTGFEYYVDFPQETMFPVSLTVTANGHRFWSGVQRAPTHNESDGEGGVRPMLLVGMPAGNPFPNIFGLRNLHIIGIDAQGRLVADSILLLPDWRRIARFIPRAVRENQRMRLAQRCEPEMPA